MILKAPKEGGRIRFATSQDHLTSVQRAGKEEAGCRSNQGNQGVRASAGYANWEETVERFQQKKRWRITNGELFRVAGAGLGLTKRASRMGTEETRQQEMREGKQRGSEGSALQAVTLTGDPGPRGKRIQRVVEG